MGYSEPVAGTVRGLIRSSWNASTDVEKKRIAGNVSTWAKELKLKHGLVQNSDAIRKAVYAALDSDDEFNVLIRSKGNHRFGLKSWSSLVDQPQKYIDSVIPEDATVLIVPDAHVPMHDEMVLDIIINHGIREGVDWIVHLGDWGEWTSFGRFGMDPFYEEPSPKEEREAVGKYFDIFTELFPGIPQECNIGNHDERVLKMYAQETGKKYGEIKMEDFIPNAKQNGIRFLNQKQVFKCGKWTLAHGHEFWQGRSVPKKPAESMWKNSGKTYTGGEQFLIAGHVHKPDIFRLRDRLGNTYVEVHTLGMAGNTQVTYDPWNKYVNGFGMIKNQEMFNFFIDKEKADPVRRLELY
jgi:predicted phosphodiesterase